MSLPQAHHTWPRIAIAIAIATPVETRSRVSDRRGGRSEATNPEQDEANRGTEVATALSPRLQVLVLSLIAVRAWDAVAVRVSMHQQHRL